MSKRMKYEFGYRQAESFHRNLWGSFDKVKRWAVEVGNTDVYSSVYGFQGEVASGPVYSGLYFDLDSPNLAEAWQDTNALISIFDRRDLSPGSYRVSFSGKKGFHIYVSPVALDITPTPDLSQTFKQLAHEVKGLLPNGTLDTHVYDKRRLWRMVNSRHAGSGLYKINLDLPLPDVPTILNLAETPRPIKRLSPQKSVLAARWLVEVYHDTPARITHPVTNGDLRPEVSALLANGVAEGKRNVTCFYLGCYLSSKGWSMGEVQNALCAFGSRCTPPLPEREVLSVVRSVGKRFGG